MSSKETEPRGHLVAAPREFFLAPVFAATPQTGSRSVHIGDTTYEIGGFNPINPAAPGVALDVRHARLTFSLLSFRDPFTPSPTIRFSMSELCRRYAWSRGGSFARYIRVLLDDLFKSYIRAHRDSETVRHAYRLFERVHVVERPIRRKDDRRAESPQYELWFEEITLSREFFELLQHVAELHHLKLEAFTSITSPLAQAIYLYIPSRAHHHTAAGPFEITLTNLLQQVSHPVPKHKSHRHKLFTQNKHSILSQLNGLETLSGVFRVHLAETADRSDWKLQAWVDKTQTIQQPKSVSLASTKMGKAFLASGRTREDLEKKAHRIRPLDPYERELLAAARVTLQGSEQAFELARALLGESRFQSLLAEAKGDALEGRRATKSANHRLMSRIMEALQSK